MSTVIYGEVMDLTKACQNFPYLEENQISRDIYINEIKERFDKGVQVILLNGDRGVGKTTLVAQYALCYPYSTISIFLKPSNQLLYNPHLLRIDVCNQLSWALSGTNLENLDNVDDSYLRQRIWELQRHAKQKDKYYCFAIDGLEDTSSEDLHYVETLLNNLMLGSFQNIKFLIAGEKSIIPANLLQGLNSYQITVLGFTLGEAKTYLGNMVEDKKLVEEFYKHTKLPGGLASIKRLLETGIESKDLLEDLPDKLPDIFEYEWQRNAVEDSQTKLILAIVALGQGNRTIEDIARLLQIAPSQVLNKLESLTFIELQMRTGVNFTTDAFREFVAKKLQHLKHDALEILIRNLETDETQDTFLELPIYLEQTEKHEDVLRQLSPEHFQKVVVYGQSLAPVQQQVELGLKSAGLLNKHNDQIRFGFYKSTLSELNNIEVLQSEIEARVSVGDYDSAVTLANRPLLNEDKLHLLSVVAKEIVISGNVVDETLQQQIKNVYQRVDFSSLGERATDISALLIYSNPDLAIDLLEQAKKSDTREGVLDWALTRLSLEALNLERNHTQDTLERIRQRITDPRAQSFTTAFSLLAGEFTAAEVVAQAETVKSVRERLFLLCEWAINNREREDAHLVVEYGLEFMISSAAEFPPTATHFRKIATPIPYLKNKEIIQKFIKQFDTQAGNIEKYGPTEDYIRLRLMLVRAEVYYDEQAAINRLLEVFFYTTELSNLSLMTSCLARIAVTLDLIDPTRRFEDNTGIHDAVNCDLDQSIDRLLETTADHFYATRGIIQALAKARPDMAIELSQKLNVQYRRDQATLEFIKTSLRAPVTKVNLAKLKSAVELIKNATLRDDAIFHIIGRLRSYSTIPSKFTSPVMWLLNSIEKIADAGGRCNAYCIAYPLLDKIKGISSTDSYAKKLLKQLHESWDSIDLEWQKIDVGFKIAHTLPESARDVALEYLSKAESLRSNTLLRSTNNVTSYVYSLKLALRAFSGLLVRNHEQEHDLLRISDQIEQIPSRGEQAVLWSDFALYYLMCDRESDGRSIVLEKVLPLLANVSQLDWDYYSQVVILVSPSLYSAHPATALDRISELDREDQDAAFDRICNFILRKQLPSEPYNSVQGQGYDVSFKDILDLCSILKHIKNDALLYQVICCVADSVRRHKNRYTRFEKTEIAQKLRTIIEERLPQKEHYIQHDGYKIVCLAQVMRIDSYGGWESLLAAANKIPNLSDRAYILAIIATCMSNRQLNERKTLLKKSALIVENLPSPLDKAECYEVLADAAHEVDNVLFKKYVRSGISFAAADDQPELHDVQRRIIDLAYTYDKEFASSLASAMDNEARTTNTDLAQKVAALNIKRMVSILDMKSKLAESNNTDLEISDEQLKHLSRVAWNHLGALNAGRVVPAHLEKMKKLIPYIAELSFTEAYPLIALIFENIKLRFSDTNQAQDYLRPLFELSLSNVELVERLANYASVHVAKASRYRSSLNQSRDTLVRVGNREEAIEYLKKWLETHANEYLKICDAYFGPEDIEVLQLLLTVNPSCRVEILTSREHHIGIPQPWEDAYRNEWRKISDLRPPQTDIVIIGLEKSSDKSPIHDRWWLTSKGGIRIGNSFHALGTSRDSEISQITLEQAKILEEKSVDRFLYRREREYMGQRLLFTSFSL